MNMIPLFRFDATVMEALNNSASDPDAAAQVLMLAAEYLRAGELMPMELVEHLANAFESAALKPQKLRGKQLALELNLTASNRRPKGDWYTVGIEMDLLLASGLSQNQAASELAARTEGGDNLSAPTIIRLWKKYRAAIHADQEATRVD